MYKYLLPCLCFLACRKGPANNSDTVTIKLAGCANVQRATGTIKICLDSLNDSRCPLNVECFWGGVAVVKLNVTGNGVHSFRMSTLTNGVFPPTDTVIENHRFRLLNVLPYPGSGSNVSSSIELKVE